LGLGIVVHYITLHYITLHYITLHYIYITLHYITLQYITFHYIHWHTKHGQRTPTIKPKRKALDEDAPTQNPKRRTPDEEAPTKNIPRGNNHRGATTKKHRNTKPNHTPRQTRLWKQMDTKKQPNEKMSPDTTFSTKTKKWVQDRGCGFWTDFCWNRDWNHEGSVWFCRIFLVASSSSLSWRENFFRRFEGILFLSLSQGRV